MFAVDVAASLWIASVVLKLKDAGVDADSIQSNIVNIAVAAGIVVYQYGKRSRQSVTRG